MDKEDTKETKSITENSNNIIYTIRPAILLEYCYGIVRFPVFPRKCLFLNGVMKAYSVFIPCLFVMICFTSCLVHLIISVKEARTSFFPNTMDIITYLLILIQYLSITITTSSLINGTHSPIIGMFTKVDKILNMDGNKIFYASSRSLTWVYLIILCTSNVAVTAYDLITYGMGTLRFVAAGLFGFQRLEVFIFSVLVEIVKSRLDIINEYIMRFIEENEHNKGLLSTITNNRAQLNKTYNWIGRPSNKNYKIRNLALAYDGIGIICEHINDIFNFQIFLTVISTFSGTIVTIWTLLTYFRSQDNDFRSIISIIIWSTGYILNIAIMSFACERLRRIRKNTRILVDKIIMDYDLPKTMRVQAKAFMELIDVWSLDIYVYDMFAVDITMLLKFIGVSTTYLIIILQISDFI